MEVLIDNAAFPTFWNVFLIAMMEFRTACIIRKPFACMLFSDVIVEIGNSSFEKSALT